MMQHGFAFTGSHVIVLVRSPKMGPLSQGFVGDGLRLPAVIVPPAVSPAASIMAPVGTLGIPNLLFNATETSEFFALSPPPAPRPLPGNGLPGEKHRPSRS